MLFVGQIQGNVDIKMYQRMPRFVIDCGFDSGSSSDPSDKRSKSKFLLVWREQSRAPSSLQHKRLLRT
jgi:hypothetical protein